MKMLKLVNSNQRGFTMIEVIMAIAVTAIITGGITMSIFQVFNLNARTSNHMIAVRQVQNAGYWVSHDAQMAQVISTEDNPNTPEEEVLTLNWAGWEYDCGNDTCFSSYEVRYKYDAVSNKLWRHEEINTTKYDSAGHLVDPQPDDQDSSTPIADHITPIPTVTMGGNKLSVTITALVGDAEEERTYEITPRPST